MAWSSVLLSYGFGSLDRRIMCAASDTSSVAISTGWRRQTALMLFVEILVRDMPKFNPLTNTSVRWDFDKQIR